MPNILIVSGPWEMWKKNKCIFKIILRADIIWANVTQSDWYIRHQTRSSLAQIMAGLLQGLPFLKIITCPTSRILKCFDLLIWNKAEKSVQIHMPGSFTCPGLSGSGKRQSLACTASGYYLMCWLIVSWTLGKNFSENLIEIQLYWRKLIWKCCVQTDSPFVMASIV